jgi:hypothetical protein
MGLRPTDATNRQFKGKAAFNLPLKENEINFILEIKKPLENFN